MKMQGAATVGFGATEFVAATERRPATDGAKLSDPMLNRALILIDRLALLAPWCVR